MQQAEEADSAATAAARRSTNEATSATAPKAERTTPAEEGLDDEEQYMSADEGANSNASDDVVGFSGFSRNHCFGLRFLESSNTVRMRRWSFSYFAEQLREVVYRTKKRFFF